MDVEVKFPIAVQAYTYFASRYGIGYDSLEIKWMINEDGSALLQRVIEIEAFSRVESLDTYLLIPESDDDRKIDFISVDSLSPKWSISLSDVKKELGRGSAMISISPPLKIEEKMRYRMVEELPPGLYAIGMTSTELSKRKSAYDYCGWNINRPTRKVSLQIEFPSVIKPENYSLEVRYASTSGFPSSKKHFEESQRFDPVLTLNPQRDKSILRLDIDYPMIGLIYILRWQPLAKETKAASNQTSITSDSRKEYLIEIRNILIDRFNDGELRTLAHDLGVDYESLPDNGKANKARELVEFLERRNQILELVKLGKELRPNVKWPEYKD
ncbi:MAG: hypothetical protein IT327_00220 [Anaerolineae bacterium]|nr:hypothetical protein [Anaerolineae bacterium]